LIINGLFFVTYLVIQNRFGIDLNEKLGLYYVRSSHFAPYQIITHLFMHGSFWHLFSNMLALWMFGNVLENYWGGKKFLLYYITTGLGAAFIHSLVTYLSMHGLEVAVQDYLSHPSVDALAQFAQHHVSPAYQQSFDSLIGDWFKDPNNLAYADRSKEFVNQYLDLRASVPTVGASGAVFGVLLAFGMLFPNTVIYLYFAIPIKAKYFVILYGALELYSGFQVDDNVAHFAHLGGMLFGFILIKYWAKHNRKDLY
jgi:membrane associated rhomboid family serine protease